MDQLVSLLGYEFVQNAIAAGFVIAIVSGVVSGRWAAGTPDEVLRSGRMSALCGSHVDVVRVRGRILVVGESTESGFNIEEPHHAPAVVVDHSEER